MKQELKIIKKKKKKKKKFKMIVCNSCKKGFVKKYNCQKYCCLECAKKAKIQKQRENDVRIPTSSRANKEIYAYAKWALTLTRDENRVLLKTTGKKLLYERDLEKRRQLHRVQGILQKTLRHCKIYIDQEKNCKNCRFYNKGKCTLEVKRQGGKECKYWEPDYYELKSKSKKEIDTKDLYTDQDNW